MISKSGDYVLVCLCAYVSMHCVFSCVLLCMFGGGVIGML